MLERMVDGLRDDMKGLREERQALEAKLPSSDEHGAWTTASGKLGCAVWCLGGAQHYIFMLLGAYDQPWPRLHRLSWVRCSCQHCHLGACVGCNRLPLQGIRVCLVGWKKMESGGPPSYLTLICIAGRLEAIPEGSALAMSEISKSLASLAEGQQKMAEGQQRLSEELGEMRVVTQVAGLMVWKGMRWTRSTASDGDVRSTSESFKRVLMEKYFPGAVYADIACMVVGKCVIAMIPQLLCMSGLCFEYCCSFSSCGLD